MNIWSTNLDCDPYSRLALRSPYTVCASRGPDSTTTERDTAGGCDVTRAHAERARESTGKSNSEEEEKGLEGDDDQAVARKKKRNEVGRKKEREKG